MKNQKFKIVITKAGTLPDKSLFLKWDFETIKFGKSIYLFTPIDFDCIYRYISSKIYRALRLLLITSK